MARTQHRKVKQPLYLVRAQQMDTVIDKSRRLEITTEPWQVRRLASFYEPPTAEHPGGNGRLYLPVHQRCWSWKHKKGLKKQRDLIDSILHNYPVPTIILNNIDDGVRERWQIYDGRHRVETLWNFTNNKFGVKNGDQEVFYKDLNDTDRGRFNDRTIPVTVTASATPIQLADVFIRLNSGKSLSQADYCHASRDTPLVQATLEIMTANRERFRPLFNGADITHRDNLPDWIGIVLGLTTGSAGNMTTSFERIQEFLDLAVHHAHVQRAMDALFDLYNRAATVAVLPKELRRYAKVGFINAFFFADWMSGATDATREKAIVDWLRVITHIRTTGSKAIVTVSGAQNLTDAKIGAVRNNVRLWLTGALHTSAESDSDDSDE